jgi:hypothetical protein
MMLKTNRQRMTRVWAIKQDEAIDGIQLRSRAIYEMGDILMNEDWAMCAMNKMESVVSEWNSANPKSDRMRIVWGFSDAESAESERNTEERFQRQQGLLNLGSLDFDLFIGKHSSSAVDHDEPEIRALEKCAESLVCVRISIKFADPQILPRSAPELFNALSDCGATSPILFAEKGDGDLDSDEIAVLGLDVHLPVETLSYRVLSRTLADIYWARMFLNERLADGGGFDVWNDSEDR